MHFSIAIMFLLSFLSFLSFLYMQPYFIDNAHISTRKIVILRLSDMQPMEKIKKKLYAIRTAHHQHITIFRLHPRDSLFSFNLKDIFAVWSMLKVYLSLTRKIFCLVVIRLYLDLDGKSEIIVERWTLNIQRLFEPIFVLDFVWDFNSKKMLELSTRKEWLHQLRTNYENLRNCQWMCDVYHKDARQMRGLS